MKLLAYILNNQILGVDKVTWDSNEFTGIPFSACTDNTIIPNNYADISSLYNWGNFGETLNLTYVEVRNEIKEYIPNNLNSLSNEEIEILKKYNLYKYFKIYDKIGDGETIISAHPPVDINYDILAYHKKRTFDKGELIKVEYFENFENGVYDSKVVEELRTYYRVNNMLSRREMTINWMLDDGTTGYTKNTVKYYTLLEAIQAGETRRSNVISNLKISVIGLIAQIAQVSPIVAQQTGVPFLNTYAVEISKYIQGFDQILIDAITNDTTFDWLNLELAPSYTVRQYLVSELTIDYTINNTNT